MFYKNNLFVIFFFCVLTEIYFVKINLEGKNNGEEEMTEEELPISTMSNGNNFKIKEEKSSIKSICEFIGNFKEKIKIKCQNIPKNNIFPKKYLKGLILCILIIITPCPVNTIYLKPLQENMTQYGMINNPLGYQNKFFIELQKFKPLNNTKSKNIEGSIQGNCKEVKINGELYNKCNFEFEINKEVYELDITNNKGEIIKLGNLKKDFVCNKEKCEKTYKYTENDGTKYLIKYEKKNNENDKKVKIKGEKLIKKF